MADPITIPLMRPYFPSSALTGSNLEFFVGREKQVVRMVRGLVASTGARYLITGYPGVGKTSFASRVIADWRKLCKEQGIHCTLIFNVRLDKNQSPDDVVKKLVGTVYFSSIDGGFTPSKQLVERLHLNYVQSNAEKVKVVHGEKNQRERAGELNAPTPSTWHLGGITAKLSGKISTESTSSLETELKYELKTAVGDLESALHLLTQPKKRTIWSRNKAPQGETRILFILDQIGDLVNMQELGSVFEMQNSSFLVLGGVELQEQITTMEQMGEHALPGFDKVYLPCQWNQADEILSRLVSKTAVTSRVFEDYGNYLNFVGQGLPRRVFAGIDRHIDKFEDEFYLELNQGEIERMRFCANLHQIIWKNRSQILGNIDSVEEYQRDKALRGIYFLAHKIFRATTFTYLEVLTVAKQVSATMMHPERERVLGNLLNVFVAEHLIFLTDQVYSLSDEVFRKIREIRDWLPVSSLNTGTMSSYIENGASLSLESTGVIYIGDTYAPLRLTEQNFIISDRQETNVDTPSENFIPTRVSYPLHHSKPLVKRSSERNRSGRLA